MLCLLTLLGPSLSADLDRTWRSVEGREVTARYVAQSNNQVILRLPAGRLVSVPIERLCPADRWRVILARPCSKVIGPARWSPRTWLAVARLTLAIDREPNALANYVRRHRLWSELECHRWAERDLKQAQALKLTSAEEFLLRARMLKTAGQVVAAHQDTERAIALDDRLAAAYRLRGDLVGPLWRIPQGHALLRERAGPMLQELEQLEHGRRIIERGNSPWQATSCGAGRQWVYLALSKLRQQDYLRARRIEESDPNAE